LVKGDFEKGKKWGETIQREGQIKGGTGSGKRVKIFFWQEIRWGGKVTPFSNTQGKNRGRALMLLDP